MEDWDSRHGGFGQQARSIHFGHGGFGTAEMEDLDSRHRGFGTAGTEDLNMGDFGQQEWKIWTVDMGIWDSRHGAFEHGEFGTAGTEHLNLGDLGQQVWRI